MPHTITLPPISVGATRTVSLDCQDDLDSAETFTGTPTITESTGALTLGSKQVNTAALTVLDRTVAIGKGIQFTVAGQVANTVYTISVSCGTTGVTPAETIPYTVILPTI